MRRRWIHFKSADQPTTNLRIEILYDAGQFGSDQGRAQGFLYFGEGISSVQFSNVTGTIGAPTADGAVTVNPPSGPAFQAQRYTFSDYFPPVGGSAATQTTQFDLEFAGTGYIGFFGTVESNGSTNNVVRFDRITGANTLLYAYVAGPPSNPFCSTFGYNSAQVSSDCNNPGYFTANLFGADPGDFVAIV